MSLSHIFFFAAFLLAAPLSVSGAENIAGAWVSSAMSSSMEAHVEQENASIKGVVYIYPPLGGKDVYHFTGTIQNGQVHASHFSGHTFDGRLLPTGEIEGALVTAKKGYRLDLVARRQEKK